MTTQQTNQMVEDHLTSLRRLACQLVGNAHDAEDAVQETYLAALRSPPARLDRARGWLETVLRNVVRKQARTRVRSARRERAVARGATAQATVDVVARQQQLSSLTRAVLSLPEDLQECVFLRYFEGVPARQIAQDTGQPAEQVYRSLERAKALIRRDLEKRDADWRQGLAMLAGLRPAATTLALGGAAILTKKLFASLSALLLISLGVYFYPREGIAAVGPSVEPDAMALRGQNAPEAPVTGGKEVRISEPEAPAPEGGGPLVALAPCEFELEILVRDTDDLPRQGVQVFLAPLGHPLNAAYSDSTGALKIQWRGRRPSMTMVYASPRDLTHGLRLRRIECHAKTPQRIAVRVRANRTVVLDLGKRRASTGEILVESAPIRDGSHDFFRSGPICHLQVDREGWSWFSTSYAAPDRSPNGRADNQFGGFLEDITEEEESSGVLGKRTIKGSIRGADGQPIAKALVRAKGSRVRTNSQGEFKLEIRVPDGTDVTIHAGGGDHGIASQKIDIHVDTEYRWDARLDRGTELTGQLVDPDGKPLAGWRVEIESEDGTGFIDGAKTGVQGRFAIPNVLDRGYRMTVFAPSFATPAMQKSGIHPERPHFLTVLSKGETGTFHAVPTNLSGQPVANARAHLWQADTGEGVLCWDFRKPLALATGAYQLVFIGPGFPPTGERSTVIRAHQATALGEVNLGEATDLDVRKVDDKAKIYFLHDAVPSLVDTRFQRYVYVPPGSYRGIAGENQFDFEVRKGENAAPKTLWKNGKQKQ